LSLQKTEEEIGVKIIFYKLNILGVEGESRYPMDILINQEWFMSVNG